MRVLFINAVCGIRSTGRICTDLAEKLENQGHEVKIAYSRGLVPEQYQKYAVKIGNGIDVCWHALMTKLFDQRGYWSRHATKKFLNWADEYNPDLIWLHNIHDYVINVEMLFNWIKNRPSMQVKWTQHDCWAFTGGCMYFTVANCYLWKTQCNKCPERLSWINIKNTKKHFEMKKKWFCGIENMTIIVVSHWLENLVKCSFLKNYPIEVIYNDVNEKIFYPMKSNFRIQHNLISKVIILGVASAWSQRKGLDDFVRLSEMLPKDTFRIVLIGLKPQQIRQLRGKEGILCLPITDNTKILAQWYSTADVFVNLSREETFGLTTLEAIKCGTTPIVYKNTACEEIVERYGGIVAGSSVMEVFNILMSTFVK